MGIRVMYKLCIVSIFPISNHVCSKIDQTFIREGKRSR